MGTIGEGRGKGEGEGRRGEGGGEVEDLGVGVERSTRIIKIRRISFIGRSCVNSLIIERAGVGKRSRSDALMDIPPQGLLVTS